MCFLGSLFHIHVFPWGPLHGLLWESMSENESETEKESRGVEGVCALVSVFV